MRKRISFILFIILFIVASFFILNIKTITRQGIDYKIYTIEMPFYLKILDFYDRHYNYKCLVNRITRGKSSEYEKLMAIFRWTVQNLREQPKGLPVVDDHVWHIIVRGYGTGDQFSDVFTTLCNYADFDAFFWRLANSDHTSKITVSLVKLADQWHIFEPRAGVYFVNKQAGFASVEDIAGGNWVEKNLRDSNKFRRDYADYFKGILSIDFEERHRYSRANIQSPVNRFFYGLFKGEFLNLVPASKDRR